MAGFRDLKVWQSSMKLAGDVYRLSAQFPKHETYGLASQLQRSAVSLPSNIAEGHGRNTHKEFHHFLGIALGSLAELETQILLALQFGYLTEAEINPVLQNADEIGKMIKGLQKSLISN
ncbi:MAG: four helix bundle protein [Gammaproteobacteria bacterium]|nr:four helix bundle protein [Gammaproteobacteria bacterium]MBU1480648.1 four helix bundle protein [Gammaproteobacteria bacterium]